MGPMTLIAGALSEIAEHAHDNPYTLSAPAANNTWVIFDVAGLVCVTAIVVAFVVRRPRG